MRSEAYSHAKERFGAAVNTGRVDDLDRVVAAGCVGHDPAPGHGHGPQGLTERHQSGMLTQLGLVSQP